MKKAEQMDKLLTQGMKYAEEYGIDSANRAEYASVYADYFYTMKKADRKLRELEKLSGQKYYEGVLNYAYARAQKDIAKWKGIEYDDNTNLRFHTKPPESLAGLYAKIEDAERFISAKTSDKRGITSMYVKRAKTINKRYAKLQGGQELTWQELAEYFEKEYNKKLDEKVGSASVFVALGVMKRYGIDDEKIFKNIIEMREDKNYLDTMKKSRKKKDKKAVEIFEKIEANNSAGIKSVKIRSDIKTILENEDIDVTKLFEDSKTKKKG